MALQSMDDKLLGEKPHNYCSSDEDSEDESPQSVVPERSGISQSARRNERAIQTGPKGVIEDWRRYKQLEVEEREKNNREKTELCKKLAMTCKSFREENESDIAKDEEDDNDEQFMEWYKQKRILEIQQKYASRWSEIAFGNVVELNRENFVEAIENEKGFVTVVIHIYDDDTPACVTVNGCMKVLAAKYKTVKFCKINVREAQMSANFLENGLPTIIVYKENLVIGNFVRISDALGEDFYAPDLEEYLVQYGILPSKHEIASES